MGTCTTTCKKLSILHTRLREAPRMRLKVMLEVIKNNVPVVVVDPTALIALASE